MSNASNYAENALLSWSLTTDSVTRPTNWYVALYTSSPQDDNSGTEVSGNNYARTSVNFTVTGNQAANNADVTFPSASGGAWGTIQYVGIFDASTSGNLLYWGQLTTSKSVSDGDTFKIPTSSLTVTLD